MPMNPDNTYGNSYQELKPYMLYGDRSAAGRPLERKDLIVQDLEYLPGLVIVKGFGCEIHRKGNVPGTYETFAGICSFCV